MLNKKNSFHFLLTIIFELFIKKNLKKKEKKEKDAEA